MLFFGCVSLLALVGARGPLLVALAFLISGLLSYVLLSAQRDQMSAVVANRSGGGRLRRRLDARAQAEDELDDQLRAQNDNPDQS